MADYWISQNRKYCDFCKCWITDNKPSVDSHEKGRRHQANVKKKLRIIQRQSAQNERESQRYDATLKHIESAALNAYRKDVQNNADLTSLAINRKIEQENLTISTGSGIKKIWNEAIDNNGKTYYYNIMTYERVMKPPKEGYASLKEQKEQADLETKRQMQILEKYQKTEGMLRQQQLEQEEMEIRARIAREKMKERSVANDSDPLTQPVSGPLLEPGKTNPYGRWQTVVKEEVHVDLQLPQQQEYYEPPVEYVPEPVVKEFKEKTVESLDDGDCGGSGETSFKKRRIGAGIKRNTRQRLDDD